MTWVPGVSLREMRANLGWNGPELYVGTDGQRLVWGGPQQAVLVLGPPRSGKTSSLVVPNVLAAPGPVVVTSTKPDILQATLASRLALGRCWLFDPSGTVQVLPGANVLRWSPVGASAWWEEALVTARVMTAAARPRGYYGESAHWTERAEALLAPLLHAAALSGTGMRQVLGWVLCQDLYNPKAVLDGAGAAVASDVLAGILATEDREKSGIFSTAAGVLAAYRSERALEAADRPNFDPGRFPASGETVYVCAPARYQVLTAPVAVAFLEQVRAATYQAASAGALRLPVTLVLDEVANIAPLPDLPAMVSEGGGQGPRASYQLAGRASSTAPTRQDRPPSPPHIGVWLPGGPPAPALSQAPPSPAPSSSWAAWPVPVPHRQPACPAWRYWSSPWRLGPGPRPSPPARSSTRPPRRAHCPTPLA